jgi:hypothetical protein
MILEEFIINKKNLKKIVVLFLMFASQAYSQFIGHSGVYYLGTANIPINQKLYDNPNIKGVVVRFRWNDIEIAPDNFDWSFIDGEIVKAKLANKKVSLQPLGVPEWMASIGATQYFYIDGNNNHTTYGQIVGSVIPWDTIYVKRYKNLISKLSAKYSNNNSVSYMNTIGGAFSRNLPDSVLIDTVSKISKPFWKAFIYNADTFAILINKMTDYYMENFPNTPLWCSVDYIKFEPTFSGHPINYLASLITKYGIEKYPDRFGLWREDLSGCNPQTNLGSGSQWYILKMNPCRIGAQMVWSVQDGPTRMNKCGILPNDKVTVLDSAIKKGLDLGMRYMEIYGVDISDSDLSNVIQTGNSLLIKKGEECMNGNNVNENIRNNCFKIYPNPSSNEISIPFSNSDLTNTNITIFNSLGLKVLESEWKDKIDVRNLPEGIYFLIIKSGNFTETKKFVIIRLINVGNSHSCSLLFFYNICFADSTVISNTLVRNENFSFIISYSSPSLIYLAVPSTKKPVP